MSPNNVMERKHSLPNVTYQGKVMVGSGYRRNEFESNIPDNIKEIDEMREFSQASGGEDIDEIQQD
jgi:hypothetical protein